MTKKKWYKIIDMVEAKFGIERNEKQGLDDDVPGEKQMVEFNGPLGKMKLEFVEKARLKDVKTLYSDRIGSTVKVDKVYDEDEKVCFMNVFKWDEVSQEWQEMNENMFDQV